MKNREKYKALIMSGGCDCSFVKEHILKGDCCNEGYIDCNACTMIQTLWLDEEAEAEAEVVDWSKIEVDTPIFVSDDGRSWVERAFAFSVNNDVWTFMGDKTSKTALIAGRWKYAKLAEPTSITD